MLRISHEAKYGDGIVGVLDNAQRIHLTVTGTADVTLPTVVSATLNVLAGVLFINVERNRGHHAAANLNLPLFRITNFTTNGKRAGPPLKAARSSTLQAWETPPRRRLT